MSRRRLKVRGLAPIILASFREIKTSLAEASSAAARQPRLRFGDKADPLAFEGNFERLLFIWIVCPADACEDGPPGEPSLETEIRESLNGPQLLAGTA